jgi:acetoin utilization deacetylase AcuC-like enzyme
VDVVYSNLYSIDIGVHVFATAKYRLVHQRLIDTGVIRSADVVAPVPATWDELSLVHTAEYLRALRMGTLTAAEAARLELPFSSDMVEGFRLMVGGTITAARLACGRRPGSTPVAIHLGGGLHHAFPDHGEGFCPFNDTAVAVRAIRSEGISRVAIVDLDVHHGNGTAFIFGSDPTVFTFSMHQQQNYPLWKPASSLDVGLPDGAGDDRFLDELERSLNTVAASSPECVFYLAGADPYEDDQLGGLRVTRQGLRQRDRMVFTMCRTLGVPVVVVLAGGYARQLEDTVAIHAATVEEAREIWLD